MEGHHSEKDDNWQRAVVLPKSDVTNVRLNEPFCDPLVKTHAVSELLDNVLDDVGCNYAGHDAVDQRVLRDVRNRGTSVKGSRGNLPASSTLKPTLVVGLICVAASHPSIVITMACLTHGKATRLESSIGRPE